MEVIHGWRLFIIHGYGYLRMGCYSWMEVIHYSWIWLFKDGMLFMDGVIHGWRLFMDMVNHGWGVIHGWRLFIIHGYGYSWLGYYSWMVLFMDGVIHGWRCYSWMGYSWVGLFMDGVIQRKGLFVDGWGFICGCRGYSLVTDVVIHGWGVIFMDGLFNGRDYWWMDGGLFVDAGVIHGWGYSMEGVYLWMHG